MPPSTTSIELHGKKFALPRQPTVIVCVDGFDPEYLDHGIEHGLMPNCKNYLQTGFHVTAESAMPSLTNPNNTSIITGVPTAVHGISGNFFLDRETRKEKMITDDSLLRGSTILSEMSKRGIRIAAITAKDKLRQIIHHDIKNGICFSSQCAADCTLEENGIENVEEWIGRPAPSQYSADLSLYVLDAGIKLLEEQRADLLYLTLSDYVQHKFAPGDRESNEFMAALDERFGKLVGLGAILGITGDHGMSNKSNDDGSPNVLFLQDELEKKFGDGSARVICPISDPFVKHHGALGSFVRVYVWEQNDVDRMIAFCKQCPQVELALSGKDGAALFEMPIDREGDIVVVSKANTVIGAKASEHDLTQLRGHRLRSHGGLSEQPIPLIMSKPVAKPDAAAKKLWKNYDIFDLVLNWQA
jgi:phosphonoacetate hydrolase